LEGYTLAANYSSSSSKGGGSYIYIRNDLVFNIINVTQYGIEKILEPCAIKIDFGEHDIIVICLYRSPIGDFYQFLHILDTTLMYLSKTKTELILCGDINVNFLVDNNYKMELTILLQTYNMTNVIEFLTRINEGHGTAIDGIFLDVSRANHFTVTSISNGLSDHNAQYIVLERIFSYQTVFHFHKIRVINKKTIKYFIETKEKHGESLFN
jgi:exonuclease III